jgi:hypothetical protein
MIVHGYRANVDFNKVASALRKHTNMDAKTLKRVISDIESGKGVNLPDDFVLREDLEELNLLLG